MAKIAWFGAGMMGSGMVEAMRRRGDEVTVWNRTFKKAEALERFGAVAVDDPREALHGAARAHIILSDDTAVDELLGRILDAVAPQTILIDHTTVAPKATERRAARLEAAEIAFVHAPVFMSPQGCRDAAGVMLVSGRREHFNALESELKKMTGDVWYLGERPDKAAALKLFGNQMLFFITAGLADGYTMARAAGVSPAEAHELFQHFKPGISFDVRGKKIAEGDYTPSFELSMARKDARLMVDAADGAELHFFPAIVARMEELIAAGHGSKDVAALALDASPPRT